MRCQLHSLNDVECDGIVCVCININMERILNEAAITYFKELRRHFLEVTEYNRVDTVSEHVALCLTSNWEHGAAVLTGTMGSLVN